KSILEFLNENRKDQNGKLKITFDQASNLLSLEDIPWDDAGLPNESRTSGHRIYHFRGFYLFLGLQGEFTSGSNGLYSKCIPYISGLEVQIDGINDSKE